MQFIIYKTQGLPVHVKYQLTRVIMSLARSLARSAVTKQASPVSATPASYMF